MSYDNDWVSITRNELDERPEPPYCETQAYRDYIAKFNRERKSMPTITQARQPRLKASLKFVRLLNQYAHASYMRAQRGAYDPMDWKEIDTNYRITRQKLIDYVAQLEGIPQRAD